MVTCHDRDDQIKIIGEKMGLKFQIDTLDGLDESIAGLYTEKDGKFVLDVSGLPEPPSAPSAPSTTPGDGGADVGGLKSALKKEREARRAIEKQIKQFDGVDPKKYTEMVEKLTTLDAESKKREQAEAKKKGQWEKLETDLKSEHQRALEAANASFAEKESKYKSSISQMQQDLETEICEKSIISAITEAKGNTTILMPHVKGKVKAVRKDSGGYEAVVVGDDGEIRYGAAGKAMSPSDLIGEMRENPAFQGEGIFAKPKKPGGSDSGGGQDNNGTPNNPWKKETFNMTEQALIYKKDPQQATKLKKEAGVE